MKIEQQTQKNILVISCELVKRGQWVEAIAFIAMPWLRPDILRNISKSSNS